MLLSLARRVGARLLLASTSEVYGDPEVHPQPESYRGCVNTIGIRSCYDEGKRIMKHFVLITIVCMLWRSVWLVSSTPTVLVCWKMMVV